MRALAGILFWALAIAFTPGVHAQLTGDDSNKDTDALLAGFEDTLAVESPWWDAKWTTRQYLTLTAAEPYRGMRVLLTQPDVLLLANTGRCRKDYADLRVVDMNGRVLPCGVLNPGADDGTGLLWCELPGGDATGLMQGQAQQAIRFYLYYGNPDAEPFVDPAARRKKRGGDSDDIPNALEVKALVVDASPPTTADGKAPTAPPFDPAFFKRILMVEGEAMRDASGARPYYDRSAGNPHAYLIPELGASNNAYLSPDKPWYAQHDAYVLDATTRITIPESGRWRLHVRSAVTRYSPPIGTTGRRKVVRAMVPYEVRVGDQRFTVATDQTPGRLFRTDTFDLDLTAGEVELGVHMTGISGLDCLILTRNMDWLPDVRDLSAPVWMRARVTTPNTPPTAIQMYCVDIPWSSHGPQGRTKAWMFKDRVVPTDTDAAALAGDESAMLAAGEWSPWAQTTTSRMPTWWTELHFLPGGRQGRNASLTNVEVEFEIATRPDPSRVFRRGSETLYNGGTGLQFLMPTNTDLATVLARTMSFDQWAAERAAAVDALGLPPAQSPQHMVISTSFTDTSPIAAELDVRTLKRLGFNAVNGRAPATDFPALYDKVGIPGLYEHRFVYGVPLDQVPAKPDPGATALATWDRCMSAYAEKLWSDSAARYRKAGGEDWLAKVRFMRLGDEIGPAISWPFIVEHPLMLQLFRDWLRDQGQTPADFGVTTWDEVQPQGYALLGRESSTAMDAMLAALGRPVDPEVGNPYMRTPPPVQPPLPTAETLSWQADSEPVMFLEDPSFDPMKPVEASTFKEGDAGPPPENAVVVDVDAMVVEDKAIDATAIPVTEKRRYYWTQRFRSWYTVRVYTRHAATIARLFPSHPLTSPNFQASPIMRGNMWDGGLDLFEFGREPGGLSTLLMEDWITEPYRVAFGMELLQAAGRPQGVPPSGLVVGGNLMQRALTMVGHDVASMYVYLYGPLRVTGPPIAEHLPTLGQLNTLTRWVANTESAMRQTRPRQADVALLVANSFEINRTYLRFPVRDRHNVYAVLQDSQIPVEIVDETAILHDNALARYKVLYVTDPHVRQEVQAAIKVWVAGGGVLWSDYGGLARDEYDQPSTTFDEVFGLASRPALLPYDESKYVSQTAAEPAIVGTTLTATPESVPWLTPGSTIGSQMVYTTWQARPDARVLATYPNSSPAMLLHPFGKGQAVLLGAFTAGTASGFGHTLVEPEGAAARRRFVTLAADLAGVQRPVVMPQSRVLSFLRDGDAASVLTLVNCFAEPLTALPLEVALPHPPTAVRDGDGKSLPFTWDVARGVVATHVDLPLGSGAMLVFTYHD